MAARRWRCARVWRSSKASRSLPPDAAALGEQGREFVRPGAEGRGLFQQHGVPAEGFSKCPTERHRVTLGAGSLAEFIVSRQNLPTAVYERSYGLGVAPAESGAPDIPCDAGQRVVVRRSADLARIAPGFAGGSAIGLPNILPPVFPYAIGHVVERRLLGSASATSVRPDTPGSRCPSTTTSRSLSARLSAISRASGARLT